MASNRMTLEGLLGKEPADLSAQLSAEELDMLGADLKEESDKVKAHSEALASVISAKYSAKAKAVRGEEDSGTARVDDGEFVAISNLPKKVDWSQPKLAAIVARIVAAEDNPLEYVKIEYSIEENKWKAWPENIKKLFLDARTVKPGKETIKLEMKK